MLPATQLPRDLKVKPGVDYPFLEAALEALSNPTRLRLLGYLTQPHYIEEIASELKVSRQAARKHLEKLVAVGVLTKRAGTRETGPVTDYVISPQALFIIHDEFAKLGALKPKQPSGVLMRTRAETEPPEAAGRVSGPAFHLVRGLGPGRRFPLEVGAERRWLIGRSDDAQVAVAFDPYASNRHAEVTWSAAGFQLTDLHSLNGTTLNWHALPRGQPTVLRHGDVVGVGRSLLLFWEGK